MNGSEDSGWDVCAGSRCRVEQRYRKERNAAGDPQITGGYYRGKWYCDVCLSVLRGEERIAELEGENARLRKKAKWAESLVRPGLWGRLLRRVFTRRAYATRMEDGLKTILSHAGSAIECCDEPGAGYLRDICEIVDDVFGIDTDREVATSDPV